MYSPVLAHDKVYCMWRVFVKLNPCIFYRNTIAGSSLGEQICNFFGKIGSPLKKLNFSNFVFKQKKSVKMTLNGLETTKIAKNSLSFLFFCFHNFLIFTFFVIRIIFGRTCYAITVVLSLLSPNKTSVNHLVRSVIIIIL